MSSAKRFIKNLSTYFDIVYFLKFAFVLTALFYFNLFYIAITDPNGRLYSSFLEQNLNYISWVRNSILYSSNVITHFLGFQSYVILPFKLKVLHGHSVEAVYTCLGLGLMSFWVAYIVTQEGNIWKKIRWGVLGILFIWFINCWRIALLLVSLQNGWNVNKYVDHHTLFNIIVYFFIALLIFSYKRKAVVRQSDLLIH